MCGIVGVIDFEKPVDRELLTVMTHAMTHRGPDDWGVYTEADEKYHVGFGHRRLSIIDLSERGKQPMQVGELTIVFNGEIYNYQEIKSELEALGHTFRSGSDTEVILRAYREWGTAMVQRLNGMFAFALLDSAEKMLYLFRDRAGVKPLYYYRNGSLLMFASELKPFHRHPGFQKEMNMQALALFFQYGYIPAPASIFSHTQKVRPGHFIRLQLDSKVLEEVKYWDVIEAYEKPKLDISEADAVEETERHLKAAFEYRMVADVPVGVLLSGGYDSTAVAALLQESRTQKLKTFTIGFEFEEFNEAIHARAVSDFLSTDHTELICTERETKDLIPELPYYYDEPFGDDSAIPTMLVSKIASQQVKVALSGDGGDEIFAGYDAHLNVLKHYRLLTSIPRFFRMPLSDFMDVIPPESIPYLKRKHKFSDHYKGVIDILRGEVSIPSIYRVSHQKLLLRDIHCLFRKAGIAPNSYYDQTDYLLGVQENLNKVLAIDYKTYLADDLLTKTDRASMAFSLEGRDPYLDYHLIEYVARLPANIKIHRKIKKYLLRKIVHRHVPREIMDRPKQGFEIPLVHWFRKDLKYLFDEYLNAGWIQKQGIFSHAFIQSRLTSYMKGRDEDFPFLWNVLIFQMWYDQWMR